MADRTDFFGKYSEKMKNIHEQFFDDISLGTGIDKSMVDRTLIQLNYSEYIEHHPEEPDYNFDIFNFKFNDHAGQIMTAFNHYFFKTREEYSLIINFLKQSWHFNANCLIEFSKEGKSICDLNFEKYDMLQTAHFYILINR